MVTRVGALLRLLQLTDSSFPTGGFAFSHGLEWLTQCGGVRDEARLSALLDGYIDQPVARQALPAALAAHRARSIAALLRVDDALDASFAAEGERNAGRVMGERLLVGATEAFGGGTLVRALLAEVRDGAAPGQCAAAFGVIAADQAVPAEPMLAALGSAMVLAVTQAAVRLNVIGQNAAGRLVAGAAPSIDRAVARALAAPPRLVLGAFTPGLDVAGILHPTLRFRMFAS